MHSTMQQMRVGGGTTGGAGKSHPHHELRAGAPTPESAYEERGGARLLDGSFQWSAPEPAGVDSLHSPSRRSWPEVVTHLVVLAILVGLVLPVAVVLGVPLQLLRASAAGLRLEVVALRRAWRAACAAADAAAASGRGER